jgi:hypothetical protein
MLFIPLCEREKMSASLTKRLRASFVICLIGSLMVASIAGGALQVVGSPLQTLESDVSQSKAGYQDRQIAQLKAFIDSSLPSWAMPSWAVAVLYLKKLTNIDYGVAEANSILQTFECSGGEDAKVFVRSYFLFKDEPVSLMYQATKDHLRAELKKFTYSGPTQKDLDYIWYATYPDGSGNVYPSYTENHKMFKAQLYLLANQEFKNESSTYQENYEQWKTWWHKWFDEHAKKGWSEIANSYLYGFSLVSICNVCDFVDDSKIKLNAEMTIDWLLADHVIEQFGGIRGGGKVRTYTRYSSLEWNRGYLDYLFFGSHDEVYWKEDGEILSTTSYRPPDVLIDLALDEDKGVYEIKERRPYGISVTDQRWQVRKYTYVTPSYILGGFQRGDSIKGYTSHSNDHLFGLTFNTDDDAFIFPWGKNYGIPQDQQACSRDQVYQYKNVMIVTMGGTTSWKYASTEGYGDPNEAPARCYFANSVLDEKIEESGWIFIKEGNAYAAYRPVSGGYEWKNEDWWSDHFDSGIYAVSDGPLIPAILEAAQASDYSSFEAFIDDIKSRYLSYSNDTVTYEASDGKMIEVAFEALYDGNNIKIDGQTQATELENYKTFESPYVNSDWNSGYIVISKDGRTCILDFRDSENPIKTCETNENSPLISVSPSTIEVPKVGVSFLVNITITNAVDVRAWNMKVTWDHEILEFTSITEGDFLSNVGSTVFAADAPLLLPNYNDLYPGEIPGLSCELTSAQSATGSGVLVTLKFTSQSNGTCTILLEDTVLNGIDGALVIEHNVSDGEVDVIPEFQTWILFPIFVTLAIFSVLARKLRAR